MLSHARGMTWLCCWFTFLLTKSKTAAQRPNWQHLDLQVLTAGQWVGYCHLLHFNQENTCWIRLLGVWLLLQIFRLWGRFSHQNSSTELRTTLGITFLLLIFTGSGPQPANFLNIDLKPRGFRDKWDFSHLFTSLTEKAIFKKLDLCKSTGCK